MHTVEYWREYDRKRALERYYSHAEERKQYNIEHHEEILEYGRNYRAKNRERINAARRRRYQEKKLSLTINIQDNESKV